MTKKMFKEAITALKALKSSDIELDETGELIKEYNMWENEEDYDTYLNSDPEEIPENVLLN